MSWQFEAVAGPFQGPNGGVVWTGKEILFSVINEARIMRFDPASGTTTEFRRHTHRVSGLGFGPNGELYACQEGSRRVIEYVPDGSAVPTGYLFEGRLHNHPSDLVVDRAGRIWFSDPYNPTPALGITRPPLDHASVMRLERDHRRHWRIKRVTFDTHAPRAVLLSPDERTLYVSDGEGGGKRPCGLRSYPVQADGGVGAYAELHAFGSDHRGVQRGIEGMCLDSDGNIVAVAGWRRSGPGPLVYVFSPQGVVLETHALPDDLPVRCAFGDADLGTLYVTTGTGMLYRARTGGRRGLPIKGAGLKEYGPLS